MRRTLASRRCASRPGGPRPAAASASCAASGGCACRCRWTGVPHCNAWALARGDGIVLVDCGMDDARLAARPRARARAGRAARSRTCACSSARTPTSTTAGRRPRCRRAPAASCGCTRATSTSPRALDDRERGARAADRDRAPERRARGAAARAGPRRRKDQATGMSGPLEVARDLLPGVVVETDVGALARVRDARPRAVARRAAPARAPAADLRRPRARPHLALLRPRLDARPGAGVPRLARRRRRGSTRG